RLTDQEKWGVRRTPHFDSCKLKDRSGGLGAALDGLELRRIDLDATGLLFLGHDTFQVHMKQTVLKACRLDFDMLGKLEAALEGAAGNALVQEGGLRLLTVLAPAADREHAVLDIDREVLVGKAGDRQGDTVIILVGPFDIVGRIALLAGGLQQIDQPVKTDGGTEKGRIVDTHETTSVKRCRSPADHSGRAGTGPMTAAG